MAIITAHCPHCRAQNMTFLVFGATVTEKNRDAGTLPLASIAAECRSCGAPIVALYRANDGEMRPDALQQRITHALQSGRELDDAYVTRVQIWPEPTPMQVPEHLPADVERAFTQGEANFAQPNCEEAAALMYRRALEIGLKIAYPDQSGSLAARIKHARKAA